MTVTPVSPSLSTLAAHLRADFPLLERQIQERPLIYLDNAATSQKPEAVLAAMQQYYHLSNANVHRGAHTLSREATDAYEAARARIGRFIHTRSAQEIVFTRNASEAINLVAYSWGLSTLQPGDEIILSVMEHHSNLVPWQMLAQRTGAVLRFVQLTPEETFDLDHFRSLLNERTRLVATVHVSNMLGCHTPVDEIVRLARAQGAKVLLDACQSVPHMPVDVQALDVDWLAFSGHKMCGPTGIGVLYGKLDLLEAMPPFLGGGEMISEVYLEHSSYAELPHKFEAGTPAIAEAIGLGAAVEYLDQIGMDQVHGYEQELTAYLLQGIRQIPEIRVYGPEHRAGLVSFSTPIAHATDLATLLDEDGIAIRAGHHCTQPLHRQLGISASARASVYIYNTREEIDRFLWSLQETLEFFTRVLGED